MFFPLLLGKAEIDILEGLEELRAGALQTDFDTTLASRTGTMPSCSPLPNRSSYWKRAHSSLYMSQSDRPNGSMRVWNLSYHLTYPTTSIKFHLVSYPLATAPSFYASYNKLVRQHAAAHSSSSSEAFRRFLRFPFSMIEHQLISIE